MIKGLDMKLTTEVKERVSNLVQAQWKLNQALDLMELEKYPLDARADIERAWDGIEEIIRGLTTSK